MAPHSTKNKFDYLSELLIITGLCLLGLVIFSAAGFVFIHFISGLSLEEIQYLAIEPATMKDSRMWLLVLQAFSAVGSFVLFPSLIRFFKRFSPGHMEQTIVPNARIIGLIIGISILMLPVTGWLAAWNESIHLPSFLQEFQQWALEKEKSMEALTLFLVDFQTVPEIILGFLVIALIAGISEEFFFRKLLQPRIMGLTGNPHVAIWVTAFLFSAIHMQFYGLIPRMILGALFGYYYYWTGRISLPAMAHVLNNGLTLTGMLLYQRNISPINVENPHIIPWFIGATCIGVCWGLATMVMDESEKIKKQEIEKRNHGFSPSINQPEQSEYSS